MASPRHTPLVPLIAGPRPEFYGIDYESPQARGLVAFFPLPELNWAIDKVRGVGIEGASGAKAYGTYKYDPEMGKVWTTTQTSGTNVYQWASPSTELAALTTEATFTALVKLRVATPVDGIETGSPFAMDNNGAGATHYPWTDGSIYCNVFRSDRVNAITPSSRVDRTRWHRLTVTQKPGANGWAIYQNGELLTTATGDASINKVLASICGSHTAGYNVGGPICDIRLYNRWMSQGDVVEMVERPWDLYWSPKRRSVVALSGTTMQPATATRTIKNHSPLWPDRLEKPPVGAVEIDWSHPLARGLRRYVLFNEGAGLARDLVLDQAEDGSVITPAWRSSTRGLVARGQTATGRGHRWLTVSSATSRSFLTIATPLASLVSAYTRAVGLSSSDHSAWVGPHLNSAFDWKLYDYRSDGEISINTSIASVTGRADIVVQSYDSASGYLIGRVNGARFSTSQVAGVSAYQFGGDSYLEAGFQGGGTGQDLDIGIGLAAMWDRALSEAELVQLSENPYCLLRPKKNRVTASPGSTATAYTLTASPGSYSWTGTSATLKATRLITASGGTYSWTGTAAGLYRGLKVTADPGSIAWTGTDATLKATRLLTATNGSYSWTGTDATLTKSGAGAYTLAANSGSLVVTGTAAALLAGYKVSAASAAFTWTGTAASLLKGSRLVADGTSWSWSGTSANLLIGRKLTAESGSVTLNIGAAGLLYSGATSSGQRPSSSRWRFGHRLNWRTRQ